MESRHRTNAFTLLHISYQHDVFNSSRMPVSGDSVQAGFEDYVSKSGYWAGAVT